MGLTADDSRIGPQTHRFRYASRGLLGLVVSLALLYWTLHDIDTQQVFQYVRGARIDYLLLGMLAATVTLPLRAVRWRHTLRPAERELPYPALFHATAIGIMANNLLPARTGELARAYSIRTLAHAPFSTAVSSIVIERVFDVIGILVLLAGAVFLGGLSPDTAVGGVSLTSIVLGTLVILSVALAALILIVFLPAAGRAVVERLCRRLLPHSIAQRVLGTIDGLLGGLSTLKSPGRSFVVGVWSLVIWALNGLAIWLGLAAFGIDIGWSGPLVLQAVIALGIALPSSPGFFGPFEAAVRIGLAPYGIGADLAVSFAVPFHLVTYFVPVSAIGIWSLMRSRLHLSDLPRGRDTGPPSVPARATMDTTRERLQ